MQANFKLIFVTSIKGVDKLNYAIDETLIPFLGYVPFRQYLPDKPHPFGLLLRVFTLVRPRFALTIEFYAGAIKHTSNKVDDMVPRLLKCIDVHVLPGKPLVVFDNFYTTLSVG